MEKTRELFIETLIRNNFSQQDIDAAMFAYDLSKFAHRNQHRDDGDRFFDHARATAIILLDEIGTTDISEVIALLLHDTGENTGMFGNIKAGYRAFVATATYRLTKAFNATVANYVIRLTKPHVDGMYFKTKAGMMYFYIQKLEEEIVAFILKMCDRLHNLRSLNKENIEKIQKQIIETEKELLPAFQRSLAKNPKRLKELVRYMLLCEKIQTELRTLKVVSAT